MVKPRREWERLLRERIGSLIGLVWRSQHDMASELGFSQAYISRVLNGDLPPSKRLLSLLAKHPKVNPHWLKEGKGEARSPFGGGALTVTQKLLPGPPESFPELLTQNRREVAPSLCKTGHYFYEVPPDTAKMLGPEVLSADFILFDSHLADWLKSPWQLDRRLCVICAAQNDRRPVLGRLKVTKAHGDVTAQISVQLLVDYKSLSPPKPRRRLVLSNDPSPEAGTESEKPSPYEYKLADIVAVALRIERDL